MSTITEPILFTIKDSNKMLIDVNTLVKNPIEHKTFYKKRNKIVLIKFSYRIYSKNKIYKSDDGTRIP